VTIDINLSGGVLESVWVVTVEHGERDIGTLRLAVCGVAALGYGPS